MQVMEVRSLVGELRPHMLLGNSVWMPKLEKAYVPRQRPSTKNIFLNKLKKENSLEDKTPFV